MAISSQEVQNALIGFSEKGIDPNRLARLLGKIVEEHAGLSKTVSQQASTIKRLEEQLQPLKQSSSPAE